jgi:hypothetical protein
MDNGHPGTAMVLNDTKKDSRRFNSCTLARERWMTLNRLLVFVKELLINHKAIDVRLSLGLRLVYPIIQEPVPDGEITRRCQRLFLLNREILGNAPTLTGIDADIGARSEIHEFYNLCQGLQNPI